MKHPIMDAHYVLVPAATVSEPALLARAQSYGVAGWTFSLGKDGFATAGILLAASGSFARGASALRAPPIGGLRGIPGATPWLELFDNTLSGAFGFTLSADTDGPAITFICHQAVGTTVAIGWHAGVAKQIRGVAESGRTQQDEREPFLLAMGEMFGASTSVPPELFEELVSSNLTAVFPPDESKKALRQNNKVSCVVCGRPFPLGSMFITEAGNTCTGCFREQEG